MIDSFQFESYLKCLGFYQLPPEERLRIKNESWKGRHDCKMCAQHMWSKNTKSGHMWADNTKFQIIIFDNDHFPVPGAHLAEGGGGQVEWHCHQVEVAIIIVQIMFLILILSFCELCYCNMVKVQRPNLISRTENLRRFLARRRWQRWSQWWWYWW